MNKPTLKEVVAALDNLYAAYCEHMHSEFDYTDSVWSPERDNDEAALKAKEVLQKFKRA